MVRRSLLSLLFISIVAVLFVQSTRARLELSVDESASSISLKELAPELSLITLNGTGKPIEAKVSIEVIDTHDTVLSTLLEKLTIAPGRQKLTLMLPLRTRDFSPEENSSILWYRLGYRLTPIDSTQAEAASGILSVSEITPEVFNLSIIKPEYVRSGTGLRALVTTLHPITKKPIPNVELRGLLKIADRDRRLTSSGTTNESGFAYLDFNLPQDLKKNKIELVVDATRGLLTTYASEDVDTINQLSFIGSTDKPLYQPGQIVHSRLLIFDNSRRVMPALPITFQVKNEDREVIYKSELETSRFGIVNPEWTIPDSAKLGDYILEFETEDDQEYRARVRVSRYELPNFAVKVELDQGYYLNNRNALATVKADYLFGQPVTRGHVKVVRETKREWNYREQKYDIEEEDKYEADVTDGRFKTELNLADEFNDLNEDDDDFYKTVTYTAYFTDASTNRTEQKRFDVRLTKEPIHVYVRFKDGPYSGSDKWPLQFYLSTSYADGSPASCTVEMFANDQAGRKTIGKLTTNKDGLAKIDNWKLPALKDDESYWKLSLAATDRSGKVGHSKESIYSTDRPRMRITTSKSIFAPGESIAARVQLTEPDSLITISVANEQTVFHSQIVHTSSRDISVIIPWKPEFKGELILAATAIEGAAEDASATRIILYPRNRELNLQIEAERRTYLPGEQASVRFQTVNAMGKQIESALGVVVVDPAVQERFTTDVDTEWSYTQFNADARNFAGYTEGIGTVTRRSLDQLDPTKRISPDVDLIAEILLNNRDRLSTSEFDSSYTANASSAFDSLTSTQMKPIKTSLDVVYKGKGLYPTDDSSLRRLLSDSGIEFDKLLDPWGNQYRAQFSVQGKFDVFQVLSAGPDKRVETSDDFTVLYLEWEYFKPTGQQFERAFSEYHKRTSGYIRNYDMLREELLRFNFDLDQLRDRWGKRYKFNFEIKDQYFTLSVNTISPTRLRSYSRYGDREFQVFQLDSRYFEDHETKIDRALAVNNLSRKDPPTNDAELGNLLKTVGVDLSTLRDPWESNYYRVFDVTAIYGDKTTVKSVLDKNGTTNRIEIKPVTRRLSQISFRSAGPDKVEGTVDDFWVATFYSISSDQSALDIDPVKPDVVTTATGYSGIITGTIFDTNGAVVMGAQVVATKLGQATAYETRTDSEGKYILRNLESGLYELRVISPGFATARVISLSVNAATSVKVDLVLKVAAAMETVTVVSGSASMLNMVNATVGTTVTSKAMYNAAIAKSKQQFSTPRVRGEFPETLLWQPELTTDKKGRAQLDFKLADNITTWKMSVIGSSAEGEVGVAETDIRAFQPFFAELEPPRVLTQGDQISLPIVLRNYLEKKQRVELEMKPESWFSVNGPTRKSVDVPAGDSQTPTFDLTAKSSIKDGKQRATARATDYSDAIEKPVTVHPDGEERSKSQSDLLESTASVQMNLPANLIAGSVRSELKIYPNLMAHIWESVEGIMQRPYGCVEQTISSTYPSLLVVRHLSKQEQDTPFAKRARRYLELGYQRLIPAQKSSGSFGYWSDTEFDIALTAYASRFLKDAELVLGVNSGAVTRANDFLISQQQSDGRWRALNWHKEELPRASASLTALVARTLALELNEKNLTQASRLALEKSLKLSLGYLEERSKELDEPYLLAAYALAAVAAGELAKADEIAVKLQSLAMSEGNGSYWSLETNTPFYGWGLAGRLETSALVVTALASVKATNPSDDQQRRNLQTRGLLFLMKNKDRYGCWYSTQATVNVLDALLSLLREKSTGTASSSEVQLFVNGVAGKSLTLQNSDKLSAPLFVDLSDVIRSGANTIELKRVGGGPVASVQVVSSYYIPWKDSISNKFAENLINNERLTLETVFDKTNAKVMEEITCRVKAERVGFRGYGMLLAEIGLPPGADVDRSSLETAKIGSGWAIGRYDVLPDRVVVYLWPRAGGTEFSFKFKPRLKMIAKSAASSIYDYYNPEAYAVIAPTIFKVQ